MVFHVVLARLRARVCESVRKRRGDHQLGV